MIYRIAHLAISLAVIITLAGCSTTGSLCSMGFFDPDPNWQERLTRDEKEYVTTLNESGEEICGWQPARR